MKSKMKFIKEDSRIYSLDNNKKVVAEITFYKSENERFTIDHTYVDESLRGQGIAGKLVEMAVEEIEKRGGKVEATCSYAKKWIEKNR
jgi:predicted GNAT family acetyltransferase